MKLIRSLPFKGLMKRSIANTILFALVFLFTCGLTLVPKGKLSSGEEEVHPIVVPYPTRTIADRVLDANTIVLAKEDADQPFAYEAHTSIRGSLADAQEIDLFMNSFNRRLLRTFPERSVVLIRLNDGEKQVWETAGGPQPEMVELVKEILANADDWDNNLKARMDFFADYVTHTNTTIRDLAYLEIGRAPYSEIRKMKGIIPSNQIHAFLRDIQYAEWHALHILLLGLSDDPYDQRVVRDSFYDAIRFGIDKRLAAWATAYLELQPDEAYAAIEEAYFSTRERDFKEIKAVQAAVSAHGSEGHTQLRDKVVEAYEILLKNYPDLVTPIVKDLTQWQRWDHAEEVREIMKDLPPSSDYMSVLLLRRYVQSAQRAAGQ